MTSSPKLTEEEDASSPHQRGIIVCSMKDRRASVQHHPTTSQALRAPRCSRRLLRIPESRKTI
eukprot:12065536-Ditylum_brightwellii.AAC.1